MFGKVAREYIMNDIRLVDITKENWETICWLGPGKEGREFVASNGFSIVQSVFEEGWMIKGITRGDTYIGFTMYGYAQELEGYELCRFMIDYSEQGKGYGQKALSMIIEEMIKQFHCNKIYLSTAPNNSRGKHIYEKYGFKPTGKICGDGADTEDIYCMEL
ncbi:MAG TPA: GNAT family N-acetyltransferase [Lachnospiraceae bacterium]|nr:GNAT family N-acetyltransferase [Lachnospiraceae bacterium]